MLSIFVTASFGEIKRLLVSAAILPRVRLAVEDKSIIGNEETLPMVVIFPRERMLLSIYVARELLR